MIYLILNWLVVIILQILIKKSLLGNFVNLVFLNKKQ